MRPLSLQISGLNSFRQNAVIDFGELLRDGLFGIFGPTGSGKSTILDAITLALYGTVRRAPNGTGGIINMSEQRCSVSFTFSAGAGAHRKRYTVDRLLARGKNGGVETKNVRLMEYNGDVPEPRAGKTNEVREMIQEIIGIGQEDFQRAVVLPQGAFADFLHLGNAQRGAVLERLFGLQELGQQLNQRLKERAEALLLRRAGIEAQLMELNLFNNEALAACVTAEREAQAGRDRIQALFEAARKEDADARALLDLVIGRDGLLASASDREMQRRRLADLRERIGQAERSGAVAPALTEFEGAARRYRDADERYRAATAQKDHAEKLLDELLPRLEATRRDYDERYEPLGAAIAALEGIAAGVEDLQARRAVEQALRETLTAQRTERDARAAEVRDHAAAMKDVEEEIAALDAEARQLDVPSAEREALDALARLVERARNQRAEHERAVAELEGWGRAAEQTTALLRAAAELEQGAEQSLRTTRAELEGAQSEHEAALAERETLLAAYSTLSAAAREAERWATELAAARGESERLRASEERAVRDLTDARVRLAAAAGDLDAATQQRRDIMLRREEAGRSLSLTALAEHLHDGAPCPLCGALDHPFPHEADTPASDLLSVLDAELAAGDARAQDLENIVRVAERECTVAETELRALATSIVAVTERVESNGAGLTSALSAADAAQPFPDVNALAARIQSVKESGVAVRERAAKLEERIATARQRVLEAEEARTAASREHARLEADVAAKHERTDALRQRTEELRAALNEGVRSIEESAPGKTLEQIDAELLRLSERDRAVEGLRARHRDASERSRLLRARLDAAAEALRVAERTHDATDSELSAGERESERLALELRARWNELLPADERSLIDAAMDRRAGVILEMVEGRRAERSRIKADHDAVLEEYNNRNAAAHVARGRVDDCWNDLCREEKVRDEADRTLAGMLAGHDIPNAATARAWMMDPAELSAVRAEAIAIAEHLATAERRLAELNARIGEDVGDRDLLEADVADAAARLVGAGEAYAEAERSLGAAEESLRLTREKNGEWNEVRSQDAVSAEAKATIEQLSKYLRGNGFIEFLANERLADVCRRASMQLRELSGGRFEILARPKEGFIIRDHGNGGGERAPSSLSGGETFLVSLSLALALSDTIQVGHAALEFFFLDEGFGTLDSELLDVVMNALERLRSKHRAIGVISHVAQLRERIPRRLIVTPPTEQAGTSVRYEFA